MTAKIVIIGGGLAGLSAGYHLADFEPVLFEKEKAIGGLCRSFTQDGFTFDCTGHLIHLKNAYTKELIGRLLPHAFQSHERLAAIYSKSTTTPYPFQANTYGLPADVIRECVETGPSDHHVGLGQLVDSEANARRSRRRRFGINEQRDGLQPEIHVPGKRRH
ncbi:MAG: hypothetical protein AUH96_01140 [Nitrospirae bacterium 13_2_20CM_2_61_4]|nr:MAG: hypothetical protein AUH96_01140 [Nitrospirae bacterium 13_2_20CM_2_61_4]